MNFDDNDNYDVRGCRSFDRASFPKSKLKGGYFDNNNHCDVHGGCLFGRVSFPKAKGKGSFPKSGSGGGGNC